jgi:hypothetical protein
VIASLILDLLFGVERRLRERKIEIENARAKQIAEARARLLEELYAEERLKR